MTDHDRPYRPASARQSIVDSVLIGAGIALAVGSLFYTGWRGREMDLANEVGFKVWQLLVMLQILVWTAVAVLNIRNLRQIKSVSRGKDRPALFLVTVYGGMLLILVPAQVMGVTASEESPLWWPVLLMTAIVLLAVGPALLSLHAIRTIGTQGEAWKPPSAGPPLMRALRRRVRPAVASVGVVIGLVIVAIAQIASVSRDASSESEAPYLLLYGAFFTGILFAVYLYVDAELDRRSRASIQTFVQGSDPTDREEFEKTEKYRAVLATAYGLGKSPRESFEGLVAVATPLIGALTAYYIG